MIKHLRGVGRLLFVAATGALLGLWFGWKLISSDACFDAGGVWRQAGGVCVGLQVEPLT
jgi:hypothetical protein